MHSDLSKSLGAHFKYKKNLIIHYNSHKIEYIHIQKNVNF